jgi:hypothetical protein
MPKACEGGEEEVYSSPPPRRSSGHHLVRPISIPSGPPPLRTSQNRRHLRSITKMRLLFLHELCTRAMMRPYGMWHLVRFATAGYEHTARRSQHFGRHLSTRANTSQAHHRFVTRTQPVTSAVAVTARRRRSRLPLFLPHPSGIRALPAWHAPCPRGRSVVMKVLLPNKADCPAAIVHI